MSMILDQKTADVLAQKIKAAIGDIIQRHGERPPGSPGERGCQEQLRQELETAGVSATLEPFQVAQKAFMAMPLTCTILTLGSLPLYWIAPRQSPIPVLLALVVFISELVFYRHVLAPFFAKKESANLRGVVPAKGERKKRLVLVGHADAAYEWRYHRLFPRIFPVFPVLMLLSILYVLVTTVAAAFTGGVFTGEAFWQWLGLSHVFVLPGLLVGLTFTNFRKTSPGAADNLSGSLCVTELLKWIQSSGWAFENTEIVGLITGSEEAGLIGARAYLDTHQSDLEATPTIVVAIDTMSELQHLAIYNKDLNGRVKHDSRVCDLVRQAGETCGLALKNATVTVGASDAAAFTQAGVPAAALCAMNPAPAAYYHNRHDSVDIVEEACLSKTLQVLAALCQRYETA